jgi:hypothetical protein
MMNVAYYNRPDFILAEVEYEETPAEFVRAFIEMCDTLRGGGWCVFGHNNVYMLITEISQLLPLEKGWQS